MTKGQQFAKGMRHFLSIGTRTRRDRKGLDLHREITEWIVTAAMQRGTLHPDQEAAFTPAFDAACAWVKDIKNGRGSWIVIEHIDQLSPWQFCKLLGDMVDAGVNTSSAGAQYFSDMRAALVGEAQEDDASGETDAAEPTLEPPAAAHTHSSRRGANRTRRATLKARRTQTSAQARIRRTGHGTLTTHCLAAGLGVREARTVASSLRKNAVKANVTGTPGISYTHGRARQCRRFTPREVALICIQYKPRKTEYRLAAAKLALAA